MRVVREPCAIWYKDVGGKKNAMTAEVCLVGKCPAGMKFKLQPSLYFESGKRVEDEWQWILTIDVDQIPMLSERSRSAELHFRIEKVSTSFMSQKFKLRVEAVPTKSYPHGSFDAYTRPIESKAKPKRCSSKSSRSYKRRLASGAISGPAAASGKRRRRAATFHDDMGLAKATEAMEKAQGKLERTEKMLEDVVGQLERVVSRLTSLEERVAVMRMPLPLEDGAMMARLDRPPLTRFASDCSLSKMSLSASSSSAAPPPDGNGNSTRAAAAAGVTPAVGATPGKLELSPGAANNMPRLEPAPGAQMLRLPSSELALGGSLGCGKPKLGRLTSQDWPLVWPPACDAMMEGTPCQGG